MKINTNTHEDMMTTIVKVLDNFTAVDTNGNDITAQIPIHARRRANENGVALRMLTTKTGRTQWRDADMSEFDELRTHAVPTDKVDKPVQPRATANVPALILLALRFDNSAPEPLNRLIVSFFQPKFCL